MGEYAEMMLDGTCCEGCGEYLHGGASGFPRYCSPECAGDRGAEWLGDDDLDIPPKPNRARGRFPCPKCGRKLKTEAGVKQHLRDRHAQ